MAALGDMRVNIGVDFEPLEWRVNKVVGGINELAKYLNDASRDGWGVFEVFPDFTVILCKQIETPEEDESPC